jgi:hypothetical protein
LATAVSTESAITADEMRQVGYYYVPFLWFVHIVTMIFLARYRLTRAGHSENIQAVSSPTS